jgi:peptide-methionine (S)-S-oxide reductase
MITAMKLPLILILSLFITPVFAEKQPDTAIFAGGCFWCMEPPFDKLDGVISTTSGYIGGHKDKPTYREVSSGTTGHTEAIEIKYDASKIKYKELLTVFWKNIDPTSGDGQFCDRGSQYRPGIFYLNEDQQKTAVNSLDQLKNNKPFKEPVKVEITKATTFYAAEDYHQDYYLINPIRYKYYRYSCGRDKRLEHIWGESS